jgi:hypothetical protein
MFKTHHFVIASLVAMFSIGAAFAGPTGTPGKNFNISWDEFKGRCANPDSFDNQREPRAITIQCTNTEHEYVADAPGAVDLAANRHVSTAVLSDKFTVSAMEKDYPIATKPGSCQRYKEIAKTITIQRGPLNCADVLGIKGDINDYCASALDSAKSNNPKTIDVSDTGVRVDTCGSQGPVKK